MLIEDTTPDSVLFDPKYSRGGVPRDFSLSPRNLFGAPPADIKPIPRSEWDARIDEQEREQSSLEHIWRRDPAAMPLDQDGVGYCWNHSVTHGVMATGLRFHQGWRRLSAFAIGCMIKNYRDEGGWAALAADFARKRGIPSTAYWPEQSMSRANDNKATWENAAKHKITSDFCDLSVGFWDQQLPFDLLATMLLLNNACPVDFNWWGHSVLAMRLVRVEKGSYGIRILNSWYDVPKVKPWGDAGFATLRGDRAHPDGALAIVGVTPSVAA